MAEIIYVEQYWKAPYEKAAFRMDKTGRIFMKFKGAMEFSFARYNPEYDKKPDIFISKDISKSDYDNY